MSRNREFHPIPLAAKGGIFGGLGAYAAALAPASALWGGLYGAGTGGLLGGAQSALNGGSFWDGVTMGAAFGLIGGAAQGYSAAKAQGLNPWTGAKLPETTANTPVAPAATQNAANKPANTNTAPEETPTTGNLKYPSNDGFVGETNELTLQPGDVIDRYGGTTETSRFVSPEGVPIEQRSLPPKTDLNIYDRYEVKMPFSVQSGTIAPWFGQPGGGIQYVTPMPIETLRAGGFIIRF